MTMVHCRGCSASIHESALTCPKCGAPQGLAQNPSDNALLIPDGIKGWSWGAFLFNWVWGIFNGTWIALLTLIPFIGFIMAIVLGIKGREWAWKNKKWESVGHFQRVQRLWSVWALWLTLGTMVIGIVVAIAIPAYGDYKTRARQAAQFKEQILAEAAVAQVSPPAPAPMPGAVTEPTPAVEQAAATPTSAPATEANAAELLTGRALSCPDAISCVQVMLEGANPRRPDVLKMAATRLAEAEPMPVGDRKSSRALNTQGLERYAQNDFVGAVNLFTQAAAANEGDAEIQSNLGLALIRAGQPQDAIAPLTHSLQIDPRRSNAWSPFAEAMDKIGRPNYAYASLLLVYEFSGNRQKTVEFFRARSENQEVPESMRAAYVNATRTIEAGY